MKKISNDELSSRFDDRFGIAIPCRPLAACTNRAGMTAPEAFAVKNILVLSLAILCLVSRADAQTAKDIKTKKGVSVALVNILNVRPGCTGGPAPVAVPVVRDKPANGVMQMLIVDANVAAAGNCPARKVPAIALFYTPKDGFVGTDVVQIEIETGNRTTSLSYRISVLPQGETL